MYWFGFPQSLNKELVVRKTEMERHSPVRTSSFRGRDTMSLLFPLWQEIVENSREMLKMWTCSHWKTNNFLPFCITHLLDNNYCSPSCVAPLPSAQGCKVILAKSSTVYEIGRNFFSLHRFSHSAKSLPLGTSKVMQCSTEFLPSLS